MSGNQGGQPLYDTLPDPRHCLRLLEIHPARKGNDIIQCRLSTWRLDMAPSYHAISYMWGRPTSTAFVKVNGINIKARRNCVYVLHQIEQHEYSQFYWIDALCINQDNNHEKSFQVAMMGDIYRTAENVLICVGHHAGDSELLFKTLRKQNDLFVRASQSVPTLRETYGDVGLDTQTRKAITKWKLSQRYSIAKRLIRASHRFEARPYFRRVWTLQERFLARSIIVCCGHNHCSGEALRGLGIAMILEDGDAWVGSIFPRLRLWLQNRPESLLARRILLWQQETFYGEHRDVRESVAYSLHRFRDMLPFRGEGFLSLWQAIANGSRLDCYDPRDKLYGMIAVVDWSGLQKPKPNYACDVFDLAVETIRLLASCPRGSGTYVPRPKIDVPQLDRAIDVAKLVLDNFKLSKQPSTKFTAIIKQRSKGNVVDSEKAGSTLIRYRDTAEWYGAELMLDANDIEWPRARRSAELEDSRDCEFDSDEGSAPSIRRVPEKFQYADGVLTDAHGRLRGLLPSSTRSGDWLVSITSIWLVLRGRPDGRFDLIGQAIGGWDLSAVLRSSSGKRHTFRVVFQVEDLLALTQNEELPVPGRVSQDTTSSTPGLHVISHQQLIYFNPGLSYAERS